MKSKQVCPLCGRSAEFSFLSGESKKWKHFSCGYCKNFEISDIAERKHLHKHQRRSQLSEESKALSCTQFLRIFTKDSELVRGSRYYCTKS